MSPPVSFRFLVLALLAAVPLGPGPARAEAEAARPDPADPITGYLAELERTRRLPAEEVSAEALRRRLRAADDRLLRGDPRAATTILYGLVESPRFLLWKDTPSYQNAEFLLGRALLRGGAHRAAERYLLRVLDHGQQAPYFVPAHRALVDLALETRAYPRLGATLAARPDAASLPPDAASELAYLRGRTAYDNRALDQAGAHFAAVERRSRFYPGAAYFRGLIASRRQQWGQARLAFCEIVDQKDSGTLAFAVDARYFGLKDLARLALGRIAHEQDRYDEAYYFYFSLPEESDYLAEALYEASWSMYEKGETEAARAFIDQFDRLFPGSPLRAEVAILRANLDLKSCAFDRARGAAAAVIASYRPMVEQVARLRTDPARRQALVGRLLSAPGARPTEGDPEGELLALLALDQRFGTLHQMARDIDADRTEAVAAVAAWQTLGEEARSQHTVMAAVSSPQAAQLLDEVQVLARGAAADPALEERLGDLLLRAAELAHPAAGAGPYAEEARGAGAMARRLSRLRGRVLAGAQALADLALADLDRRLRAVLRQARLVQIDAAVGKKKKLEIEITNLARGALPGALFHKLQAEGALADDEEYWPYEGEYWSDEYTGFK